MDNRQNIQYNIVDMDFKAVIESLIGRFNDLNVRYALMGGFALGLWGNPRATSDIDFLVHRDDIDNVDTIMTGLDYECKYKSDNVSQYRSPLRVMGEVDFLHAFRDASLDMLERSEKMNIFSGAMKINVLRPEDLIGLKIQAIVNDPDRELGDRADIESLLSRHGDNIDWTIVKEYFKLFNRQDVYEELKERFQ